MFVSAESYQLAANAGTAGLHMSFYRKANEFIQVGVETEYSLKDHDSITTFGYLMDIPKMSLIFKGAVAEFCIVWKRGACVLRMKKPATLCVLLQAMMVEQGFEFYF